MDPRVLRVEIAFNGRYETRFIIPQTEQEGAFLQELLLRVVAAFYAQYDATEIRFRLKGLHLEKEELRKEIDDGSV